MLIGEKLLFVPSVCATFSLHNKLAVCKPALKLLSLKWKPHRDELLIAAVTAMDI
jgi:hypothetical protein